MAPHTSRIKLTFACSFLEVCHCFFFFFHFRGWVMFRPSAVTGDSSFTHTRKKTVHKRTCTHRLRHKHAHPHTDGPNTPTAEFPFTCSPCLPADALNTTFAQSWAAVWHFHCNRQGRLLGRKWRVLIPNYTVCVSFGALGMSVPLLPNFTSLCLSQTRLHPAEKKDRSTHRRIRRWRSRRMWTLLKHRLRQAESYW